MTTLLPAQANPFSFTCSYHYFEIGGENYHTSFDTWEFMRGQELDAWVSMVKEVDLPKHLGWAWQQNWKNRTKYFQEEQFSGYRTVDSAIEWLKTNGKQDNWFLQVELFDPHEPYSCK